MISFKVLLMAPLLLNVASGGCQNNYPTEVTVNLDIATMRYDQSKPMRSFLADKDALVEEWRGEFEQYAWASDDTPLGALIRGGIGITVKPHVSFRPYDKTGRYQCPVIRAVDLTIHYEPAIILALDLVEGSCRYNAVLDHLFMHHEANKVIVEQYAKKIGEDIPKIVESLENRYVGRTGLRTMDEKAVEERMDEAVRFYTLGIIESMFRATAETDTREALESIRYACN